MKRLTVLALLAAVVAVVPMALARTSSQSVTTVKVAASEYKFTLSRKTAVHGKVTFKVTNMGKTNHDFKIAGKKTPTLKPRRSATVTVTLKKGRYGYVCTIDSHAKFGMKGVFRAT